MLTGGCLSRTAMSVHAHSHNDYERARPLWDALAEQFDSVEADLYWVHGQILVSHHGKEFRGTLKELYLEPLRERVRRLGSVNGDGRIFYLWLDLKAGDVELRRALHELLSKYEFFAKQGPVVAILTGDDTAKVAFGSEYPQSPACRDSNFYSAEDPPADATWCYYALNFRKYVGDWDGTGSMPGPLRARMEGFVRGAHVKGRKIRFWKAPDRAEYWQAALDAGVDFIQTDDPKRLGAFLRSRR